MEKPLLLVVEDKKKALPWGRGIWLPGNVRAESDFLNKACSRHPEYMLSPELRKVGECQPSPQVVFDTESDFIEEAENK